MSRVMFVESVVSRAVSDSLSLALQPDTTANAGIPVNVFRTEGVRPLSTSTQSACSMCIGSLPLGALSVPLG